MSDPIETKHRVAMQAIADVLMDTFEGFGFTLLVFDLDTHDGRMNYVSNARREDMLCAMKEFIAHAEGRMMGAGSTKQ